MIHDFTVSLNHFFSFILTTDKELFHEINQVWINSYFDVFFKWITDFNQTKWFLVVIALYLIYTMRARSLAILAGCALSILLADVTAARIIKPLVHRQRPQFVETQARVIVPPQGSYSFPSNHAANVFAVATFLGLSITGLGPFTMLFAFLVAYSRVYVGVHYPLDVIGGGFLGFFSGLLIFYFCVRVQNLLFPEALQHLPKRWKKKTYGPVRKT